MGRSGPRSRVNSGHGSRGSARLTRIPRRALSPRRVPRHPRHGAQRAGPGRRGGGPMGGWRGSGPGLPRREGGPVGAERPHWPSAGATEAVGGTAPYRRRGGGVGRGRPGRPSPAEARRPPSSCPCLSCRPFTAGERGAVDSERQFILSAGGFAGCGFPGDKPRIIGEVPPPIRRCCGKKKKKKKPHSHRWWKYVRLGGCIVYSVKFCGEG